MTVANAARWTCDACGLSDVVDGKPDRDAPPSGWVDTLAWTLCPTCIQAVRVFLRERQVELRSELRVNFNQPDGRVFESVAPPGPPES